MSQFTRSYRFIRLSKINLLYALLLGVIPTIILMFTSPLNLSKYEIELRVRDMRRSFWLEDLESDMKKEKLAFGANPDSSLLLNVMDEENSFLGQFNFDHALAMSTGSMNRCSHDINGDGISEIILLTQKDDSIFINAFDYANLSVILENRFVTTIGGFNQKLDFHYHYLGWYDANNDAIDELYFSIAGGFALNPRQVFRYDFFEDSLLCSINTGASYIRGEVFTTDGDFRLVVSSSASGNISPSYPHPYHDSCAWIFSFDKNLELISNPIPLGKYPSQAEAILSISGSAFCVFTANSREDDRTMIIEISPDGEIVDSLMIPGQVTTNTMHIERRNEILNFFSRYELDQNQSFAIHPLRWLPDRSIRFLKGRSSILQEDLDHDGRAEAILFDRKTLSFMFFPDGQFKKGERITPLHSEVTLVTAKFYDELQKGEIAIATLGGSEIYEYRFNPIYRLRILIWVLIYCLSVSFVLAVMYLQRRRMERQHKLEQEVADLNLQNLRNQLDPHFTFNALNSVGNAIYQEDKDKAYDLFQRFIRMIRSSLLDSQQVFRSLDEELQFTIDYLEFQKARFKDRFVYSITLEPELDPKKNEIPKMLIQGFAENAVKHAFHGIDYEGKISISLFIEDQGFKVIIEDNGIGIKHSKELGATSGTQKGEQIYLDQIKQINKLYQRKIAIKITDKADLVSSSTGTKVEILLFH